MKRHPLKGLYPSIPLRFILLVPFVVQTVGAVVLIGYLSYRSGQHTVENLANQLLQQTSKRVSDRLDHYLQAPQQIVATNHLAVVQGTLNLQNREQLRQQLWQQMLLNPSLPSIAFWGEDGSGIGYYRFTSKDAQTLAEKASGQSISPDSIYFNENQPNQRRYFQTDAQGKPMQLLNQLKDDFRSVSWYQDAKRMRQQGWLPVSPARIIPVLQTFAVVPVQDAAGKLQGFFTVNYMLSEISVFLNQLQLSPTGQVFIIERSGNLVATSVEAEETGMRRVNGKPQRLPAVESQDLQTREVAQQLQQEFGSLRNLNAQQLRLTLNGQRQFVQTTPYQNKNGLDWLVVMVIPESDFMATIQQSNRVTALLCLLTLGLAIASGSLIANRFTANIRQLNYASQTLAAGDLNQRLPTKSIITEVQGLTQAFNQMAEQLRQLFHNKLEAEAARQSEARFQHLATSVPGMIYTYTQRPDGAHGFEYVSAVCRDILELEPEQAIAEFNLVLAQIHPDDRAAYQAAVINSITMLEPFSVDVRTITPSGQHKWLEAKSRPLQNNDGSITWYGILMDVSDRKRSEHDLQQAKEAAEAASKAKSVFLANMSHELRTPLNAILGFSELMKHEPDLSSEYHEYVTLIYSSGEHLLNLISEILNLAKIEAGKITLEPETLDLEERLRLVCNTLTGQASRKNVSLQLQIDPEVPRSIVVDGKKLQQVLLNLLGNAIKFTDVGRVTLRVTVAEATNHFQPPPQIPAASTFLCFEVEDTGVGIAPAELNLIFDAFAQTATGKKVQGGTGLGLTISRRLVQLMGGDLTVRSVVGQGSSFSCTLPVETVSHTASRSQTRDRIIVGLAADQRDYRILVVDDQPENRLLLVSLLKKLGLTLQEATSGETAIACWQQWHPHLILMDMRMPGLDGYEATRQIRAEEQRSDRPDAPALSQRTIIIALTAQALAEDRAKTLAAGCNDYISKPFTEEILFRKLTEHLGLQYLYQEIS